MARTSCGRLRTDEGPFRQSGTPTRVIAWRTGRRDRLAYYLDYRNERPRFVEGFWDVVDWEFVAKNLAGAAG